MEEASELALDLSLAVNDLSRVADLRPFLYPTLFGHLEKYSSSLRFKHPSTFPQVYFYSNFYNTVSQLKNCI